MSFAKSSKHSVSHATSFQTLARHETPFLKQVFFSFLFLLSFVCYLTKLLWTISFLNLSLKPERDLSQRFQHGEMWNHFSLFPFDDKNKKGESLKLITMNKFLWRSWNGIDMITINIALLFKSWLSLCSPFYRGATEKRQSW